MNISSKYSLGVLFLVLMLLLSSCKKYPEGPWFSLYSKIERVTGDWYFAAYKVDGVDLTEEEEYTDNMVTMTRNGHLRWVQGYIGGDYWRPYGPSGEWKFANNKMQVEMHFTESVEEEFTLVWDIMKLEYGDLRLQRYEDGKKIRWELWSY